MDLKLKGKMLTIDIQKCYEENKMIWSSDPIQLLQKMEGC